MDIRESRIPADAMSATGQPIPKYRQYFRPVDLPSRALYVSFHHDAKHLASGIVIGTNVQSNLTVVRPAWRTSAINPQAAQTFRSTIWPMARTTPLVGQSRLREP